MTRRRKWIYLIFSYTISIVIMVIGEGCCFTRGLLNANIATEHPAFRDLQHGPVIKAYRSKDDSSLCIQYEISFNNQRQQNWINISADTIALARRFGDILSLPPDSIVECVSKYPAQNVDTLIEVPVYFLHKAQTKTAGPMMMLDISTNDISSPHALGIRYQDIERQHTRLQRDEMIRMARSSYVYGYYASPDKDQLPIIAFRFPTAQRRTKGGKLALLLLPVSVGLDIVTSPFQAVFVLLDFHLLDALSH